MNRWLFKLIGSSPKDSGDTLLENRLPNELLREIFKYVNSTKELVILCRVSRIFRLEAERQLYTSINVGPDLSFHHSVPRTTDIKDQMLDSKRQIMLFRTIKTPRLSEIVTDIRVQLMSTSSSSYPCRRDIHLFSRKRGLLCACDIIDNELGEALRGVKNLEQLWINCCLCTQHKRTDRHHFLQEIRTNSLGTFRFICVCSSWEGKLDLQLPAFKTIHTIELSPHFGTLPFVAIENCATLPELKTLVTTSAEFLVTMMAKRPINTVLVRSWDQSMHTAAIGSIHMGSLQRLSVEGCLTLHFLDLISQNFQPYINLHQIGRFNDVTNQALTIFDMLKALSVLPRLSTLVMVDTETVSKRPKDYSWNQEFLHELKMRLPKLSKVRLLLNSMLNGKRTSEYVLWEFIRVWNKRNVSTSKELMENSHTTQGLNMA